MVKAMKARDGETAEDSKGGGGPGAGRSITVDVPVVCGLGAALALVVGSLGTWGSLGPFSVAGTAGSSGKVVLVLGIAAAGLVAVDAWLGFWRREISSVLVGLIAIVAVGLGIDALVRILGAGTEFFGVTITPAVGWGLVVVVLAALGLLAWAAFSLVNARRSVVNGS
jgi:hypothetical protein